MSAPVDAAVRERALHPTTSFIVQAPAGSGKTELLTRRVLTLLATVDEPEEILAITFTRKAASEMRQRVVEMLVTVAREPEPVECSAYEAEGRALAQAVLRRDAEREWQLITNPQRLNLRTIDALATQLAHRLPVTSALGAPMSVTEDARALYRQVAERFIDANISAMPHVLLQLGNRLEQAQALLANLLANRDQWKRHVYGAGADHDQLRQVLESMLAELVESRLDNLCATVPDGLEQVLPLRLQSAYEFLLHAAEGDVDEIPVEMQAWFGMDDLPGADVEELAAWDSIAMALLTSDGGVRKRLTIKEGFPAKTAHKKLGVDKALLENHKQAMVEILDAVREHPDFVEALVEVRSMPYPRYADEQWALLSELLSILPDLLLELQLVFAERRTVDFPEVAERAQRALGTEEEPTDLALAMDLSLKHVLVDEFQDTSQTQFRLFEQLVRGWDKDDGRTFFVVGDPMQSIYRFRDGDVALFGQARDQGIGTLSLESLTLTVNFRAAPTVVDWVNESFSAVFPERADPDSGAVPYSPSTAFLDKHGSVELHPLPDQDKRAEAEHVAALTRQAISKAPDHQVAILVRTRSQTKEIFDALRSADIVYESVDMDLVGERAVVRDLLSLCLALRYPHDRLHWLALLRAPFVGLTLNDLYALMLDAGPQAAVVELLRQDTRQSALSCDGRQRVERLLRVIEPALKQVARGSLMPWVESVWLQLGGPAVCTDEVDINAAEQAIATLVELEADDRLWQQSTLSDVMSSLYAQSARQETCQVQVMTLHKAKGLEFDTVILPALDRKARGDDKQLLNWFESSLDGEPRLLLAPFEQSGLDHARRDPINRLLRKARERCDEQEKLRLLYVACTRAKHHLHLLIRASHGANGLLRAPISSSLLAPLWPLVQAAFKHKGADEAAAASKPPHQQPAPQLSLDMPEPQAVPRFEQLPLSSAFPPFDYFQWQTQAIVLQDEDKTLPFKWAGRDARDIGTVVHLQLQHLADNPAEVANPDLAAIREIAQRQLRNLGVGDEKLEAASERVLLAVNNTLNDDRGRWILKAHEQARTEWALTGPLTSESADTGTGETHWRRVAASSVIIDRTFIDESGTRWIIDFKTGDHAGGQVETFLDSEQSRYADQLERYADIMKRFETRPIRLGLYFPVLKGWREWEP